MAGRRWNYRWHAGRVYSDGSTEAPFSKDGLVDLDERGLLRYGVALLFLAG